MAFQLLRFVMIDISLLHNRISVRSDLQFEWLALNSNVRTSLAIKLTIINAEEFMNSLSFICLVDREIDWSPDKSSFYSAESCWMSISKLETSSLKVQLAMHVISSVVLHLPFPVKIQLLVHIISTSMIKYAKGTL